MSAHALQHKSDLHRLHTQARRAGPLQPRLPHCGIRHQGGTQLAHYSNRSREAGFSSRGNMLSTVPSYAASATAEGSGYPCAFSCFPSQVSLNPMALRLSCTIDPSKIRLTDRFSACNVICISCGRSGLVSDFCKKLNFPFASNSTACRSFKLKKPFVRHCIRNSERSICAFLRLAR